MADYPVPGRVPMPRPRPDTNQFYGEMGPEMGMMDAIPQGLDDPNSVIAELLRRMQGSADQTRIPPEMEAQFQNQLTPPGGAQPGPVGTGPGMPTEMGEDPQAAYIRMLMESAAPAGASFIRSRR